MKTQTPYLVKKSKSVPAATPSFARLMRPTEADEAPQGQCTHANSALPGRWSFRADIPADLFEAFRCAITEGSQSESNLPVRLNAFRSSTNREPYGVITHQVQGYQHRILMYVADPEVQQFLDSESSEMLRFVFTEDGTSNAVALPSPLQRSDFHQVAALARGFREPVRASFLELPWLLQEVFDPAMVHTLIEGQAVRKVAVSVLLPAALGRQPGKAA